MARLQAQAFEAINDSVRSASPDTLPLVAHLVPLMLTKLSSTMQTPITSVDEHERQSELQVRSAYSGCLGLPMRSCPFRLLVLICLCKVIMGLISAACQAAWSVQMCSRYATWFWTPPTQSYAGRVELMQQY